jgi:hypothetical protein
MKNALQESGCVQRGICIRQNPQVRKIKDRVHTRLMKALAPEDFDYCIAIDQDPGEEWLPMPL